MAKLIYAAITSLDGYIEDADGRFHWAVPDAEVHAFVNDLERPVGTHLYGRRMYETMAVWQTLGDEPGCRPSRRTTPRCGGPSTRSSTRARSTPCRRPAPASSASSTPTRSARLKQAADRDISVSGPGLAQHAFRAGLVDEVHLFVFPVLVGGGKPGLPGTSGWTSSSSTSDASRNGVVHLHHRTR